MDIDKLIQDEKALMLNEQKLPVEANSQDLAEHAKSVESSAISELGDSKYKDTATKKWVKVKKKRIDNVIEGEDVVADLEKAKNKADRQAINNRLYVLKQEKKRSKKEQRHLNRTQREEYSRQIADFRWKEYEATLHKYGYNKTPSSFVFRAIVFIDGIVCFLEGLNKASNKFVKAMKWVVVAGLAVACYYIIKAL